MKEARIIVWEHVFSCLVFNKILLSYVLEVEHQKKTEIQAPSKLTPNPYQPSEDISLITEWLEPTARDGCLMHIWREMEEGNRDDFDFYH